MKFNRSPIFILTAAMTMLPIVGISDDDETPFDEARLFFELNDTDGDLGIHGKIDGDEWRYLEIEDPNDRKMMNIWIRGRLRRQGLTELFFESAEPTFDELDPEVFFRRFPQGEYDIEGYTLDREERESEVYLSHVIPAAPDEVAVNGFPSADLETCEDGVPPIIEDIDYGVIIEWQPVTQSHAVKHAGNPEKIALGSDGIIDVRSYEVVVEVDDTEFKSTVIIPGDESHWEFPDGFFDLADGQTLDGEDCDGGDGCFAQYKYEILVRTNVHDDDGNPVMIGAGEDAEKLPGNKSAIESCFLVPVEAGS